VFDRVPFAERSSRTTLFFATMSAGVVGTRDSLAGAPMSASGSFSLSCDQHFVFCFGQWGFQELLHCHVSPLRGMVLVQTMTTCSRFCWSRTMSPSSRSLVIARLFECAYFFSLSFLCA